MDISHSDDSLGVALAVGAYAVAEDITIEEPHFQDRKRMQRALDALKAHLTEAYSEFFVAGTTPDLSALLDGSTADDRRAFLIELAAADPFAPYWFRMTKARERSRVNALRRIAERNLSLDADDVAKVASNWRTACADWAKSRSSVGKWRIPIIIAGGAAIGGLAVAAGPLIATVMPAASGLSGAAAVSAGLAQLGFGSIASGGLGMTGGLWMLGLAGTAVGSGGTALGNSARSALNVAISTPGAPKLVEHELRKLVASARLAKAAGWFDGSISKFDSVVERITSEVESELELEISRNDDDAPRVRELKRLVETARWAGSEIAKLLGPADGAPESP